MKLLTLLFAALALASCDNTSKDSTNTPAAAPQESSLSGNVEVLHWWTSGSEGAALNVLKEDLESQGVTWSDMPVSGGGGDSAMTVLRTRITSGNAPTAAQVLGYDIKDWAKINGAVANLNTIANAENWDSVVPEALKNFSKHNGVWIAAPVNVHSSNWIWINKEALDATGGRAPTSWDELILVLDAMKANGLTALAHGGQAWQEAVIFDAVVMSLGKGFYKSSMIDLDTRALGGAKMLEVFRRMETLRSYVDDNFSGRDWNIASGMVIEGKAGMQIQGDWAKGEFVKAGKKPEEDFVCIRFPGTEDAVVFLADQFVMFDIKDSDKPAQLAMASAIMKPKFQSAFNVVKGSVPARLDVADTDFDSCGKKAIADFAKASKNNGLFGSLAHGHAAPAAIKNAMYDVITGHFNGVYSNEEAVKQLVIAVAAAK